MVMSPYLDELRLELLLLKAQLFTKCLVLLCWPGIVYLESGEPVLEDTAILLPVPVSLDTRPLWHPVHSYDVGT